MFPELAGALHPHQNKWQSILVECFEWLEAEEVLQADRTAWVAFDTRLKEWREAIQGGGGDVDDDKEDTKKKT
tara:strand:+ start:980 stop:1198 length:219 start_codon:yes stop_codon:yes gene_type:complete